MKCSTYFLSFEEDDDDGPICTWFVGPPIAIVNGDEFSWDASAKLCCRRLNSLSLSVVNCDVAMAVVVDEDDEVDDAVGNTTGGLFSMSTFTFSIGSCLSSPLFRGFASFEDVEEDVDGGLASKNQWKIIGFNPTIVRMRSYKVNMDHDDGCEPMFQKSMVDVDSLDVVEKLDRAQWNVDDGSLYSNDDNRLVVVDETNHQYLTEVARKKNKW